MMKSATLSIVLVMLVVSLTTLFIAGDACDKVATMSWREACNKSCDWDTWCTFCQRALKNAPETAEVTVYALNVTRLARLNYEDTMPAINQMLTNGTTFPAGGRAAVELCKVKYGDAHGLMASVEDQLSGCDFTRTKQEYIDAENALLACLHGLWKVIAGSPLLDMVLDSYDLTMVAYSLNGLVVGQ